MISNADLAYSLNCLKAKQPKYRLYRNYYRGDQRLAFATDSFRNAFGVLFREFAYNRTAAVVDSIADRLTVTGWETDSDQQELNPIEQAAADLWRANRMQRRQGEIHMEATRSGDAYLIVWPDDDGNVRMTPNLGHLVDVVYDDEYGEEVAFAVKGWKEERGPNTGRWRVTVYEPDVIRRFITPAKRNDMPDKTAHLVPYNDDEQPETPNDFGRVPVFHFANNAMTGEDGQSELADIIPLQDALNKEIMDMLVAGEFLGFPQRVIAGLEPSIDPVTGQAQKPFDVAKDRIIMLGDAAAKWGQFDPADMAQFTAVQNDFDLKISRVSRVPVHWINQTGDFPSGEALKTAEAPFVAKVIDRQVAFGDVWADAMQFALNAASVSGDTMGIQPLWAPAASRSEQEALTIAVQKKAIGIPDEQIWTELGYTADEIASFAALRDTAAARQAEQFASAFNRGEVPIS